MHLDAIRWSLSTRSSGPAIVAHGLRYQIVHGELQAGDRLPDERTLALQLRVARTTIRTALAFLQAEGLIERRQGLGTVVCDFARTAGPGLLPDLCNRAVQQGELVAFASELLSVRRHLAQAVLERIPAPITAALAAPFEAAIDRLQRQIDVDGDFNEIVSADLEVAQALIAASGSSVLGLLFNPISATLRRDPQLRMALYQRPLENLRAWRAMFAWCASDDRDTAGILDAMRLRDEQLIRRLKDQNLFDSAARQAADELILQGVEQS